MARIAFSPDDASPSRARLGRVAAMIADAERAAPADARDAHPDAGVVVPLLARRPRPALPRPRTGGYALRGARSGAPVDMGTAVRSTCREN